MIILSEKYFVKYAIKNKNAQYYNYELNTYGTLEDATLFKFGEAQFRLDSERKDGHDTHLAEIKISELV